MSLSQFELLPDVALENIAVALSDLTFLGPPTDLMSFFLLSKAIYHNTSRRWVFAQVFRQKFDISAPVRRFGEECSYPGTLARELAKRFETLKRFKNEYVKNGHIYIDNDSAETLRVDLWRAYLLCLEDDGKNAAQLVQYAAVDVFAAHYISEHGPLQTGVVANRGWTVDNEANSLATELFWHTEKARIPHETPSQASNVLAALDLPFAFPSNYPSELGSIKISTNSLITSSPDPTHSQRPPRPVSRPCVIPDYFDRERTLVQPPIAQAAIASSSVRYEKRGHKKFTPDMQLRFFRGGLTVAEMQDYHAQPDRLRLMDLDEDRSAPGAMESRHFDQDWRRLFNCCNPQPPLAMRGPVLTPGMLHGKWIGDLFRGQPNLENIESVTAMEIELREYYQHSKDAIFPFSDKNTGTEGAEGGLRAWFPPSADSAESNGRLVVSVENTDISSTYRAFNPATAFPPDDLSQDPEAPFGDGVWDIILIGNVTRGPKAKTNQYFGRIRSWDGLAVIQYRPADEPVARHILYGYLRGHNNIVGRWRDCLSYINHEGWSGAWTMTRCS